MSTTVSGLSQSAKTFLQGGFAIAIGCIGGLILAPSNASPIVAGVLAIAIIQAATSSVTKDSGPSTSASVGAPPVYIPGGVPAIYSQPGLGILPGSGPAAAIEAG